MSNTLTEKQKIFLSVLYEEADGDIREAMNLAGYDRTMRTTDVTIPLAAEIRKMTKQYIEDGTVQAAKEMINLMKNPHLPGQKDRLAVLKELLDRGGFDKSQKVELETSGNVVFMLPDKKEE